MSPSRRLGITLIEVIVVAAIIALLFFLMVPAVRRVREPANRMLCASQMRQIMIAMHNYHADRLGPKDEKCFPTGCFGAGMTPEERLSWMVKLLPYLEAESTYRQFRLDDGYGANRQAAALRMKLFRCPSDKAPEEAITHYVASAGIGLDAAAKPAGDPGNGFMGYDRQTSFAMIKDGNSHTIGLLETTAGLGPWAQGGTTTLRGYDPVTMPLVGDKPAFGGLHVNKFQTAMVDGSVREVHKSIDSKVLAALITIAGSEKIEPKDLLDWD